MGTRHMKFVLTINSMHKINWYVDALYVTHSNYKGHTSMMMTMGFGALVSMSRGQKINVKISTEAEIVGLDYSLGDILWGKYFLEEQGYHINPNIVH